MDRNSTLPPKNHLDPIFAHGFSLPCVNLNAVKHLPIQVWMSFTGIAAAEVSKVVNVVLWNE